MLKYDKLSDSFKENGKEVKPDSKGFMDKICLMVIHRIEQGENLADVTEIESDVYPTLASILSHIDDSHKLSELRDKAEKSRLAVMKEQLLKLSDSYKANPTSEMKDLFVASEKLYSSMTKQVGQDERVKLVFNSILPADFWEGEPPPPKSPRSVSND